MGQDTAAPSAEVKVTWKSDPYYLTSFAVHRSRRYNQKMSAFYQGLGTGVRLINAVAGCGAFLVLLGGKDALPAQVLIGLVAVASAIDGAVNFSKRSKQYHDLCRRFTELAASMAGWDATEANLRKANIARLKIEADEPPVKEIIHMIARNDELRARGYPASVIARVSSVQAFCGYFITYGMKRLNDWRDNRSSAETSKVGKTPDDRRWE